MEALRAKTPAGGLVHDSRAEGHVRPLALPRTFFQPVFNENENTAHTRQVANLEGSRAVDLVTPTVESDSEFVDGGRCSPITLL
jgi:hypothetical protein